MGSERERWQRGEGADGQRETDNTRVQQSQPANTVLGQQGGINCRRSVTYVLLGNPSAVQDVMSERVYNA